MVRLGRTTLAAEQGRAALPVLQRLAAGAGQQGLGDSVVEPLLPP